MKRSMLTAAAVLVALSAAAQEKLTYSLPRTGLEFTVTAVRTDFTAGPYAAYAAKYLGLDVRTVDEVSWAVTEVGFRSFVEADPGQRFSYTPDAAAAPAILSLTSQGLVACSGDAFTADSGWRFPYSATDEHLFAVRPANLTSAEGPLWSSGSRAVTHTVVVEKSEEAKAAEVAERIFAIRENKYNILVGDTDATYSGEAMKAATDALDAMEAELLSLFTGSSRCSSQRAVFEVIPEAGLANMVAFRLSPSDGLVAADDYSGKPYFVQVEPESAAPPVSEPQPQEPLPAKKGKKAPAVKQTLHYRVPAICTVSLSDGESATLLRRRVPVYQCGTTEDYPIY